MVNSNGVERRNATKNSSGFIIKFKGDMNL